MRELLVDLAAIRHNLRTLAARVAPAGIIAIVKADAYGHGLVPVARAASEAGVAGFGVVDLEEARALRGAGITEPILTWIHGPEADLTWGVANGIDLGVGSVEALERVGIAVRTVNAFAERSGGARRPAIVHLKADTGLGRGGAMEDEWRRLVLRAAELVGTGEVVVRGIWSHLANASLDADRAQFAAFDAAIAIARLAGLEAEVRHIGASAAMLTHPDQTYDLVRVGIAMYGVSPFGDRRPAELGLRPAMELAGTVVQVKRVPAGLGVSYGHRYVTRSETTLALVPLGYADGLPRAATGRAPVVIGGRRYQVAGAIAMDQVVIDVGDDEVQVGDRAVFWGDPATGAPSVQEWADAAGTISYELLTKIGSRVRRKHVDGGD